MAAAYRLTALQDFTGGLNLRADAFSLARNESPDLLNVEVDPRGGVAIRKGADRYSSSAKSGYTATSLGRHRNDAGTEFVLWGAHKASDGKNYYIVGTGGSWSEQAGSVNGSSPARFASMKQSPSGSTFAYLQNGVDAPYRLTASGPTFTALTQTFNDNLASPNNGDMPIARMLVTHKGYMWLGVTTESATTYPHRVRWSHPGRPEDWQTNDFIDVGSDDGDVITALVADGDRLLVFKNRSIWGIYGYDSDTFQVEQISDSLGAVSQEAVVETPNGIYFFHGSTGVHRLTSKGSEWCFENLQPALDDGRISSSGSVYMTWARRRLYLSVLWTETGLRRTFMYDPTLGRGAWVMWDIPSGPMATLTGTLGSTTEYPIAVTSAPYVIRLEQDRFTDNLAGSNVSYPSNYATSWVDAGAPTVKKKWGRLRCVLRAVADASIVVGIYYDYDSTVEKRSKTMIVEARSSGGVWDSSTWDNFTWGGGDGTPYEVERSSSIGSSTAVQFRFEGPLGLEWSVNSIVIPYRQRRAR